MKIAAYLCERTFFSLPLKLPFASLHPVCGQGVFVKSWYNWIRKNPKGYPLRKFNQAEGEWGDIWGMKVVKSRPPCSLHKSWIPSNLKPDDQDGDSKNLQKVYIEKVRSVGGGKNVGDGRRKNIYWGFSGYYYLFTSSLELHYWMCFYIPSGASEAKND